MEKTFSYVVDDGTVAIQKLALADQFRMLLRRLFYDQALELQTDSVLTNEILTLSATLHEFLQTALDPIRRGEKKGLVAAVPSVFLPVLEQVCLSEKYTKYYDVEIIKPHLEYDIPHEIKVILKVKR